MGFWKGVGYFFCIVTVIAGLAVSFSAKTVIHEMYGLMIVVGGVFAIFLIRIIGSLDSMQSDLRFLANREKKFYEPENEKHPRDLDDKDKLEEK